MNWEHKICVAPMMDYTDRHCRFFHRLISPNAFLYTEMINANAVVNGDTKKLLSFDLFENPVGLQLGGSDPTMLAKASKIGSRMGYKEINLNCGCPSPRVVAGKFGASLMEQPDLVADCIKSMLDSTDIEVTIKHRIGVDKNTGYGFVSKFVEKTFDAGCKIFIVHARNALLNLSPKKNREVPPIKIDYVRRLKKDFPSCSFIANGGLDSVESCLNIIEKKDKSKDLPPVDGVMIGRAVIKKPKFLQNLEKKIYPNSKFKVKNTEEIIKELQLYFDHQQKLGEKKTNITKQWHGLFSSSSGAKKWRKSLSEGMSPVEAYESIFYLL